MVATAAPLLLSPRDSPFDVFNTSGWVLFGTSFSAALDWSAGWRSPGSGSNQSAGLEPALRSATANGSPPPLVYSRRSTPVGMRQMASWSRHHVEVHLLLHRPLVLRWDPPPCCYASWPRKASFSYFATVAMAFLLPLNLSNL